MYVQLLYISGFTSFKAVAWQPERLNVLIGPNGSGKSNLLRALELIRASAAGTLRDFVLSKGGLPRLLWGESAQKIEFEIEIATGEPAPEPIYSFTLRPVPQSAGFRVGWEALGFEGPSTPSRVMYRNEDGLTVAEGGGELVHDPSRHLPEAETALSMVSALWIHPVPYRLQQELRAWAVYHDLRVDGRAEIRRSAVVREEKRISPDGQNLIPVLKTLYEGDFKDAIDSGMSAAFPDD